jgi:hypothetical protein
MAKLTDFKRGDKVRVNGYIAKGTGKVLGEEADPTFDLTDFGSDELLLPEVKDLVKRATAWLKGYKKPEARERLLRVELDNGRKMLYNAEDLRRGIVRKAAASKAKPVKKVAKKVAKKGKKR